MLTKNLKSQFNFLSWDICFYSLSSTNSKMKEQEHKSHLGSNILEVLGVNHFSPKPYQEFKVLSLLR